MDSFRSQFLPYYQARTTPLETHVDFVLYDLLFTHRPEVTGGIAQVPDAESGFVLYSTYTNLLDTQQRVANIEENLEELLERVDRMTNRRARLLRQYEGELRTLQHFGITDVLHPLLPARQISRHSRLFSDNPFVQLG